jgi:hypothetical protein
MKFLNFYYIHLWVIFALLDPDPNFDYGFRFGSTDLIESGSNTDPDVISTAFLRVQDVNTPGGHTGDKTFRAGASRPRPGTATLVVASESATNCRGQFTEASCAESSTLFGGKRRSDEGQRW